MPDFILVNDVHLSDRAPSSCTDTYLDDLFDLLDEVSKLARKREAGAVILAGDVVHFPTPSRTSHSTVMRLIDWAQNCPTQVYVVIGNHDTQNHRIQSINETQPLGVALKSGALKLLDGWVNVMDVQGALIYGVPWQIRFTDEAVAAALEPYRTEMSYHDADQHALVVTHAPLYPPGQELKFEFYPTQAWAEAMGHVGTVHYGHVHHLHGVYEVDGVTFSNCGALSRGSLHEHNLKREIQVAVWNSGTGVTEHVTLPHKPASEVFRLQEALEAKQATVDIADFLRSIDSTQLSITSTEAVVEHVRGMQLEPEVVQTVEKLLEQVQA